MAGAKAAVVATIATAIPTVTITSTFSISFVSFNYFLDITLSSILICLHLFDLQLASVKMLPWAKANLNHSAQALIISTGNYYHSRMLQLSPRNNYCGCWN